jgi:predicted nucleotidyltransferase
MSNAEMTIPAEQAMNVASQFMSELHGTVTRAKVAGSLRRGKSEVHDIEIIVAPVLRVAQSTLIPGEYVGTENKLHNLMLSLLDAHKINRDRPRKDVKSNPFGPRYYRIN